MCPLRVDAAPCRWRWRRSPATAFRRWRRSAQELEACLRELGPARNGTQIIAPPTRADGVAVTSPWPVMASIVALLAIGAVGCGARPDRAQLAGRGSGAPAAGAPSHCSRPRRYDPYGTGGEHDELAHYATDGNAATFWKTEHYDDAPSLAGKPGVGLVLDPGRAVALHAVHDRDVDARLRRRDQGRRRADLVHDRTCPRPRPSPAARRFTHLRRERFATTSSGSRGSGRLRRRRVNEVTAT